MPEQQPVPGIINLPIVRSPAYREVYAANLRFRITGLDASLTFLNSVELTGGTQALQEEVSITMPFAALKILAEHIAMVVQTIEQELGPIRVPVAIRPTDQHRTLLVQALKATPMAQ